MKLHGGRKSLVDDLNMEHCPVSVVSRLVLRAVEGPQYVPDCLAFAKPLMMGQRKVGWP